MTHGYEKAASDFVLKQMLIKIDALIERYPNLSMHLYSDACEDKVKIITELAKRGFISDDGYKEYMLSEVAKFSPKIELEAKEEWKWDAQKKSFSEFKYEVPVIEEEKPKIVEVELTNDEYQLHEEVKLIKEIGTLKNNYVVIVKERR